MVNGVKIIEFAGCSGLDLDTKTRQQIFDEFQTIKWDENICDYDIDDVEGDWINVGFR